MEITPLIDIVFLQLIFFMLTSSFVLQPQIKIHLPEAATGELKHQKNWVITISEKGHLHLGAEPVGLATLRTRLTPLSKSDSSLLIEADRQAPLGAVVAVWDLCRSLGIRQVNVATRRPRHAR